MLKGKEKNKRTIIKNVDYCSEFRVCKIGEGDSLFCAFFGGFFNYVCLGVCGRGEKEDGEKGKEDRYGKKKWGAKKIRLDKYGGKRINMGEAVLLREVVLCREAVPIT